MSDDTTNQNQNANSPSKMNQDWTKAKQQQAFEASKLPQASQEKVAMVGDIYDKRLNTEKHQQQRSRSYRELKNKTQLLENYIREDAPRPNDPQARENDLKIIDEQAKRMVQEKEAYYLNQIERERHATMEQVIKEEQQKQAEPGGQNQSPEQTMPEPEQER